MAAQKGRLMMGLLAAFGAAIAAADCDEDSANLLAGANCGFDSNLSQWNTTVAGTFSHDAADGSPDVGSLAVDADTTFSPTMTLVSACVGVPASTELGYGVHHRLRSGTDPSSCFVQLQQFTGAGCTGSFDSSMLTFFSPAAGWLPAAGMGTTNATTVSGRLQIVCDGGFPTWQLGFDNGFIGPGLTVPVTLVEFDVH